jgi:hypothetical protein
LQLPAGHSRVVIKQLVKSPILKNSSASGFSRLAAVHWRMNGVSSEDYRDARGCDSSVVARNSTVSASNLAPTPTHLTVRAHTAKQTYSAAAVGM